MPGKRLGCVWKDYVNMQGWRGKRGQGELCVFSLSSVDLVLLFFRLSRILFRCLRHFLARKK